MGAWIPFADPTSSCGGLVELDKRGSLHVLQNGQVDEHM